MLCFLQTRDEFDTLITPMGLDKADKAPAGPGSEEPSRFMDVSCHFMGASYGFVNVDSVYECEISVYVSSRLKDVSSRLTGVDSRLVDTLR